MSVARTVPRLDNFIGISTAQRNEFRENGHLLVRGLLNGSEAAVYRQLILDAAKRRLKERRKPPQKGIYGRVFGNLTNLWQVDDGVRQLVLSKRLGKVAADLLGVGNVRIYHDHALFKDSGGRSTYWHQDQYYWPLDTSDTVTVCIALTDQSVDMGMFVFASGSHKFGTVMDPKLSSEPDGAYRKFIKEHRFPLSMAAGMRAGDGSWYYGNTVHHTSANVSDRRREMMTVTYMADGARVARPVHPAQEYEWKTWLSGLAPGRLAMSELNPLVL